MKVSASILSAKDRIICVKKLNRTNLDYFHIDVMDGEFVNNYQMPVKEILQLAQYTKKPLDIHLMVENPLEYIEKLQNLNVEYITFHVEISQDIERLIKECKNHGYKVGLAIKPNTNINELKPYLKNIDLILVMSVEPGFGGQKFIENTIVRIENIRKMLIKNKCENILIEVDGGINNTNIKSLINAKVDIAVSGSYIVNSSNYQNQIDTLR
jgi:ribulose-phosphate 3-epimerase